jgi:hypothetical protein
VDNWYALLKGCSFLKVSDDGRNCMFSWSGSGRYPSWECEFAPVPVIDGFGFLHFETTPLILRDLSLILSKLFVNDLIRFSQDERLCITKDGLRFLELIGPEMDDPDMLLRWRNHNGCWGGPEHVPSMDRWLNKGFRSIKRRVSELPSSPFTEPDVLWDKVPHTHRVIFGRYVPLSRGDWGRLDVQEAVSAIDVINRGMDWQTTRYGVVRNKMYLGSKEEPIGLWIGVPIGQFDIGTVAQRRVGPLVDQSKVTEEVSALAPGPLSGLLSSAAHELGFWVVDRVNDKSCRFFPYDPSLDRLPNEARPIVTHAKWLK